MGCEIILCLEYYLFTEGKQITHHNLHLGELCEDISVVVVYCRGAAEGVGQATEDVYSGGRRVLVGAGRARWGNCTDRRRLFTSLWFETIKHN